MYCNIMFDCGSMLLQSEFVPYTHKPLIYRVGLLVLRNLEELQGDGTFEVYQWQQ